MTIAENIRMLKNQIPQDIKIVAVSKTRSVEEIMEAYKAGQLIFGENKVQELISKQPLLPGEIEWHFIGHLQTNKVKQIIPFISLIHSLDSKKLLRVINKEARLINRSIQCLLQFHIATEETKYGLDFQEAEELIKSMHSENLENVVLRGVMGMATFTDNEELIRKEFQTMVNYFGLIKRSFFADDKRFTELSFGMSGDYLLAVQEGSTMIRIGTLIFGDVPVRSSLP